MITLGGGCFWCLQPIFEELRGVEKVVVGYAGGNVRNPSYEDVCTGSTGHAEVIQVTFNTNEISIEDILKIFFSMHDPTTLNRQGADVGTQYRSVILHETQGQKAVAGKIIKELETAKLWRGPFVTEIKQLDTFYPAEKYHQNYFQKNPYAGYCRAIIAPKVSKFRKQFYERLKK